MIWGHKQIFLLNDGWMDRWTDQQTDRLTKSFYSEPLLVFPLSFFYLSPNSKLFLVTVTKFKISLEYVFNSRGSPIQRLQSKPAFRVMHVQCYRFYIKGSSNKIQSQHLDFFLKHKWAKNWCNQFLLATDTLCKYMYIHLLLQFSCRNASFVKPTIGRCVTVGSAIPISSEL